MKLKVAKWSETKKAERFFKERGIKKPVVRNGKQSTLGYQPDVWKSKIDYLKN